MQGYLKSHRADLKSIANDGTIKIFEKMQQMINYLSHDLESKYSKKLSQLLFCNTDLISGSKPNITLLVVCLFEVLLFHLIIISEEEEYLKIFEVF